MTKQLFDSKLDVSKKGNIIMNEFKEIMKTALIVTIIYIIAVLVSLILCDKLSDLTLCSKKSLTSKVGDELRLLMLEEY